MVFRSDLIDLFLNCLSFIVVFYAGVAPPGWDPDIPRKSNESKETMMDPPVAVSDPYGWLRDDKRENKEVIQHLQAENDYSQDVTKHLNGLQDDLYKEFLSSIQETDYTTPRPRDGYWYYTRTYQGLSYKQYCRAPKTNEKLEILWDGTADAPILVGEEAYLDINDLAKGRPYCSMGAVEPSPSQNLLAYSVDYSGDEKYEMFVRNLETGEDTEFMVIGEDNKDSEFLETSGSLVWGKDDLTLYYMTMDAQHRPYRLYQRRNWNGNNPTDTLLKEELDDLFWSDVSKTLDGKYLLFESSSSETSEIWFLPTDEETMISEMQCIASRRNKVLYEVEHGNEIFWIWTNVNSSPNMKLMKAPVKANSADDWNLVEDANGNIIFDGSLTKSLDSVTVLRSYAVFEGREDGIPRIWIFSIKNKSIKRLEFEEAAHDVGLGAHYEFDAKSIAISYDSLLTPPQTIEVILLDDDDNEDVQRRILKAKTVPGYHKESYGCDRLEVLSRDGETKIPISVVYSNDAMDKVKNGERVPVHLYGYGSYGMCCEADFDSTRLPLLQRGMIYVIAHVRGGGEMGRQWYEEPNGAKFCCKKNTFNDFVDVAKFLVSEWTTSALLSCEGRSAGGMLVGASINQVPELFRVAILGVPFVDVVGTMVDASIPLTAAEWAEVCICIYI